MNESKYQGRHSHLYDQVARAFDGQDRHGSRGPGGKHRKGYPKIPSQRAPESAVSYPSGFCQQCGVSNIRHMRHATGPEHLFQGKHARA